MTVVYDLRNYPAFPLRWAQAHIAEVTGMRLSIQQLVALGNEIEAAFGMPKETFAQNMSARFLNNHQDALRVGPLQEAKEARDEAMRNSYDYIPDGPQADGFHTVA
jgi:hypothetical protein